ncbi:hypothetical protein KI387_038411, partial [Taxus chinensis]
TSMATQTFLVFGGIFSGTTFGQGVGTQSLGITSGSGSTSQTVGAQFSNGGNAECTTTLGPLPIREEDQ